VDVPSGAAATSVRHLPFLFAFLILAFHFVDFSAIPYDAEHDSASHAAFAYFTQERLQFGVDVFENAGPLAFAHYSSTYSGMLTRPGMALNIGVRLALALLVVCALRWMPGWIPRMAWMAAIVVPWVLVGADGFPALDTTDAYSILTLYLAGLALLRPVKGRLQSAVRDAGVACLLATMALMKHPLLVLAAATGGIVVSARLARRDATSAVQVGLFAALFVALAWALAGQQLGNLPAFLLGIASFSHGYNEAMAIDAPPALAGLAAGVLASAVALSFRNARRGQCSVWQALLGVPFAFVEWKYGMVRGDPAHVLVLFLTALHWIPAMAWATDVPAEIRSKVQDPRSAASIGAGAAISTLAFVGVLLSIPLHFEPAVLSRIWGGKLDRLLAPGRYLDELEAELAANRERHALPRTCARVGSATIDQFGVRQGPLLLNGLRYRPRPTPITLAVANRDLLLRNEAFYRGRRAPEFVLVQIEPPSPGDRQLVTQRDSLALGALFDDYHPSLAEGAQLLLERNPPEQRHPESSWQIVSEREIRWSERISIDWRDSKFTWASIEMRPRWTARLRSILLRPPSLRLRLWLAGGEVVVRRFTASAARVPFLVSPLLESNQELLAAYTGGELRRVLGFALEPGAEHLFASTAHLSLYSGPEPSAYGKPWEP